MDLIQRLPKAALVTIVAFLFFGGAVGVVVAAGSEPLPETFGVAEPQVGDRWEYAADMRITYENESETDTDFDMAGFEWLESDTVYDRDGVPRHVQTLMDVRNDIAAYVDMATKRVVAQSYDYPVQEYAAAGAAVLGVPIDPLARPSSSSGNVSIVGYFDEPSPCGFFTDLQGQNLSLGGPINVYGGCLGLDPLQGATLFEATAVQTIDGVPAVGFEATDGKNTTRLWYNPNIPYPVRMEMEMVMGLGAVLGVPEDELRDLGIPEEIELEILFKMTGFVPGSAPWGEKKGPLPSALSTVEIAPTTRTGPDDSGVVHPFPLSESFQGAMDDLTYSGLRDFMTQYPDAVVVKAHHWATVDGDYDVHSWAFRVWTDESGPGEGSEQYWTDVEAERRIAHPGTPAATLQQATGPEESYQAGGQEDFVQSDLFEGASWDKIPVQAPTVASAMGRFEEATGAPASTYGFDYTCQWFCWLDQPDSLSVGSEVITDESADLVTGEPGRIEAVRHFFRFDEEGRLAMEERTETQGATWTAGLLGTSGATPSQYTASDDISTPPAAVWQAPPPEATAGISFVAVLIGAAYWLWPSIKTFPLLGGFSRVRSDQMLQNPMRAQMYETIKQQPGIHYQGLIREVGKGGSVVDHHLRKLQQGGYVSIQKGAGFTCIFPEGVVDHRIMAAVPAVKTEGASKVLREVLAHPGGSVADVARALGLAKSTVSYHVTRLRKAHLLEEGRELFPTPDAKKALVYAA